MLSLREDWLFNSLTNRSKTNEKKLNKLKNVPTPFVTWRATWTVKDKDTLQLSKLQLSVPIQ